ncbi:hypothetical protein GQ43DRAFT_448053 [Delitschia confertaspora ATCC 74209]|uniref:Methyltransferase domain-containing protein n=1 Tax=Delitschia confertaspora ATCC 74209 TaxID=1513339 RepID=A0A9P4JTX5_9PLEO|nr:hypothetical protein GQ43DRAFT_448053 [Delitschia confertaspora ATCC 74209]
MAIEDRRVPWYDEKLKDAQLTHAARQLLEIYSDVPSDQVTDHVVKVRDEAWNIFPYPCIGQFRFLSLSLKQMTEYPEILQRIKQGAKLLDMGCCFGQEIRQLVADGAPSENLYGCDLRPEYIELGYKLFLDKDRLHATFLTADIFGPESAFTNLKGQLDFIFAGSFFHLWSYHDQKRVGKVVASLLKPQAGSMILGRQVGAVNPGERTSAKDPLQSMFVHNVESIQKMWKEIGDDMGTTFKVEAKLTLLEESHFKTALDDSRRIWFTVRKE